VIAGGRPDLRRILVAYTVNELGTWFGYIALAVAVYDHTHSALAMAGLGVSARVLPALAVPALVARVEASTHRGALSGLYFIEAVATAALAILLLHFWLPGVLLIAAVDGTAALAANALLRAAAARAGAADPGVLAPEEGARRANASLNVSFSASVAAGPALAGVFVTAWGASSALLIDAASFAICGLLLLNLRPSVDDMDANTVAGRLRAAWSFVRAVPQLKSLLMGQAAALVFFTAAEPIEVLYAKATLRAGDSGFGAIVAVWGIGMVLGSLLFRRWVRRPLGAQLVVGTLGIGIAYIGLAAAPTLAVACLAALVGGAGNGMQGASLISAVQQLTPPRLHARMMGAVESIASIAPAIGFALGGLVAAASNPRVALLVAGMGASLLALVLARICRGGIASATAHAPDPLEELARAGRPSGQSLVSAGKASG
jgi:hypothetical protein